MSEKPILRSASIGNSLRKRMHVETPVQLSHKTPDSHIVVKVDFDKDNSTQTF